MADERRVVIELKVSGSGDDSNDALKNNDDESKDLVKKLRMMQNPFGAIEKKLLEKATLGKTEFAAYATNQIKNLAKKGFLYSLNKYFNLSEDYKAEQDLNNTMSILSHVSSAYTSVLAGAIAGAKTAGAAGAVVGAVAGAAIWTGNTLIDAVKAWDQQNIQLSTSRIQSGYQKVRLGLVDDGRGTQN